MKRIVTNILNRSARKPKMNRIVASKDPVGYMASIGVHPSTIAQFQKLTDDIKTKETNLKLNIKDDGGDTNAQTK